MPDRPPLTFSPTPRRSRRGLRRVGAVVVLACVVAVVWLVALGGLWTYAWIRLPADEFPVLEAEPSGLGGEGPSAPADSSTVLVAVTAERDATAPRPEELVGPVVLLQFGGPRQVPAALALPEHLEVSVDGRGTVPLSELQAADDLDALARAVVDYTEVRVDHVVGISAELLPDLVEILGPVEVCSDQRCRARGADEVRAAIDGAAGDEAFVGVLAEHARAVGDRLSTRWALTSPLEARRVIEVLDEQLTTDVSLRGTSVLDVARAIAEAAPVDREVVPLLLDGAGELIPVPEPAMVRFQRLRDGTAFSEDDPDEVDVAEDIVDGASVAVLNGAGVDGLASRIEGELATDGFNVVGTGNAPTFDRGDTVVQYADGDAETGFAADRVAEALGDVRREGLSAPPVFEGEEIDILVTLGEDLVD